MLHFTFSHESTRVELTMFIEVNSSHESTWHAVNSTHVELATCQVDSKPSVAFDIVDILLTHSVVFKDLWLEDKNKDLRSKDMDKDLQIGPRGQGPSSSTTTLGYSEEWFTCWCIFMHGGHNRIYGHHMIIHN